MGIGGWRLDVADELTDGLLDDLRTTVKQNSDGEGIMAAPSTEVKEGKAHILCTVNTDDTVQKYEVTILDINRIVKNKTKSFSIKVTDKKLIEKTGGIVQGMSGSPIIQNDKIVGAVTHVFVNDPTRGYGIFIENMLSEAVD